MGLGQQTGSPLNGWLRIGDGRSAVGSAPASLEFRHLRGALTAFAIISPSLLPKATLSMGAGAVLFTSERTNSA
jgi:hypothetical protein